MYIRYVDTMHIRLSKWGNSLAIRIPKEVTDHLGVSEGDEVEIEIFHRPEEELKIDLTSLPTFKDKDPEASQHHDRYLYGRRRDEDR